MPLVWLYFKEMKLGQGQCQVSINTIQLWKIHTKLIGKLETAFKLLVKRGNLLTNTHKGNKPGKFSKFGKTGTQFLQSNGRTENGEAIVPGTDGKVYHGKICYSCNKPGHIAPVCPNANGSGTYAYNFSNQLVKQMNKWWILLDTCSTCCVLTTKTSFTPSLLVLLMTPYR